MIASLLSLAAAADAGSFEGLKNLVDRLSVPELSLPFFTVLFVLMLVFYRTWTKPAVFWTIMVVFCAAYFGAMFIDKDYLSIVAKPDNVPITLMLLLTLLCLWLAFRQAAINDENIEHGRPLIEEGKDDKVLVWPDLVYSELIALVLASAVLILWAVLLPAPLESPANQAGPPNPSKAPWYFLGLQELLVYFDPWMAGVVLPTMILTGLIALPYIDTNPKGNGYYTFKQRPFAISSWLFGFLILWIVLIVFGTFLRGPNWNFFGPFAYWDAHLTVPLTNINLSEYFWLNLLGQPLPTNPLMRESVGILLVVLWLGVLPVLLAKTVFRRMAAQMGTIRYAILAIHLVVMAMVLVKMVLRWLFQLKYFVNLPEFNLNL